MFLFEGHSPWWGREVKIYSLSFGGQKYEVKLSAGTQSLQGRWRKSFPGHSSFWWLPQHALVFLGLWLYNSNLYLSGHMASSSSVCFPCVSLIRTLVIGFRTHLDNLGCPHPKILNLKLHLQRPLF